MVYGSAVTGTGVVGIVYVIRPGKIHREIVAGQPDVGLAHPNGHVPPVHRVGAVGDLLGGIAVPGETLQHDSVRRGSGFVDHVVKGVPACILPVAVDVQVHPQRVGVGRNVGRALHMEVQVLTVPCKLGTDDVVAPGIVAVMRPDVPVRVPVARIADGGGIVRLHRAPLRLACRQVDGRLLRGRRKRAHALVAADEIDKLIVVGIPQGAA